MILPRDFVRRCAVSYPDKIAFVDGAIRRTPDRNEIQRAILRQFEEQVSEFIDPLNRLPDLGIEKHQDALKDLRGHGERAACHQERLAGGIGYDPYGKCARDAERLLKQGGKFLTTSRQRRLL